MITEFATWLIFFSPLISFVIIAFVIRPFLKQHSIYAGHLTILAIGTSFVLSIWALGSLVNADESILGDHGEMAWTSHSWLTVGTFDVSIGVLLDPLTAIMLIVVTGVSLMVQIYSVGYMKNDTGYSRYFAYMSLFSASMIGLVLASNIVQLYVFWELVGLCSYLLIGFWYHKPSAAAAAKKAFIVTRLGDFGFLLAIIYLFFNSDSFQSHGLNPLAITDIYTAVAIGGVITSGIITWIAVGIFAGAVGKSAQFPLHTWLPDAMEGPTPVSALIHAATMVAAGVFLVARFFPLYEVSTIAMNTVAIIGGITAIFAASMGLVMNDIKRVLAYSTISQLGFMMLALGVGAYSAAIFHLFTHAFFKALLFLGSGSVSHATGTFDMRFMGGLRKMMPWTYTTFLIGGLGLAGIFPLSGFWSKDEILTHAWIMGNSVGQSMYWLCLIAVFMTAFYIFRVIFMTFEGEFRGAKNSDSKDTNKKGSIHLGESPATMVCPMVLLGVCTILAGFFVNPIKELGFVPIHWLTHFLNHGPVSSSEVAHFNIPLAASSSFIAASGILLAYLMYQKKWISSESISQRLSPLYNLITHKYYFDEAYESHLVTRFLNGTLAKSLDWADKYVVDRIANTIGWFGANTGNALRQVQTGQLQGYGLAISVGIIIMAGVFLFFL